ncbi:hypothetical protein MJ563_06815 [Klebsiella pneumoniae]|nr:hypothetical protein MJ563_06815 [Klebsiella pneumoniae]
MAIAFAVVGLSPLASPAGSPPPDTDAPGVDAVFARQVADGEQRGGHDHAASSTGVAPREPGLSSRFPPRGIDMLLVEQRTVTEQQTMTFRLAADAKAAQNCGSR